MTCVMWFRRDLRLQDNIALANAIKNSEKLIFVFQVNPNQFLENSFNQSAFFASVKHFQQKVNKISHLQILYGEVDECFEKLKQTVPDWNEVYYNIDENGFGYKRDQSMKKFFNDNDIKVHEFHDHHLHSASEIKNNSGELYKIFTPYYNKWKTLFKTPAIKTNLDQSKIKKETLFPDDEKRLEQLILSSPKSPLDEVGETAAKKQLEKFIKEDLAYYDENRDYPLKNKTSHLSSHLRTGEISIRTVWQELQNAPDSIGKQTFEKELCWRDFYNMIYYKNPNQKTQPIKSEFAFVKWNNDEELFEKWKNGQTGYPIVDAAMRQLKQTGWMHNRLRMITASFLTKDLLIYWQWGEKYFQQMLVDYDPASNIGGWQWAASTGTDAVPYFRIFNPKIQSEKFDPTGAFIRKYVIELAKVPAPFIHEPQKLTLEQQQEYQVEIPKTYPHKIVDHKVVSKKAIAAFESSKELSKSLTQD